MTGSNRKLILASASPRRRELLKLLDLSFESIASDVPEIQGPSEPPEIFTVRIAREKAEHVAKQFPDALVIGADTVVVVDGVTLGKPVDDADAARMLRLLSGRVHEVLTGVALVPGRTAVE